MKFERCVIRSCSQSSSVSEEIKFTPAVSQADCFMRTVSCGAITAGNLYPVILQYLFIHSQTLPTHTSLGFQMSFLIQFIKPITPGNCNPSERREVSSPVFKSVGSCSHSQCLLGVREHLKAEVRSLEECIPCMKLGECNSCTEPGGSFRPSLRLSTSLKSLNFSLLFTSHRHPSQWSLWETSSLSLSLSFLPPPIYLFIFS